MDGVLILSSETADKAVASVVHVGGGTPHVYFCIAVVLVLIIMAVVLKRLFNKQRRITCKHKRIMLLSKGGWFDDGKCKDCGQRFKDMLTSGYVLKHSDFKNKGE